MPGVMEFFGQLVKQGETRNLCLCIFNSTVPLRCVEVTPIKWSGHRHTYLQQRDNDVKLRVTQAESSKRKNQITPLDTIQL
jgi:hypothetical protein